MKWSEAVRVVAAVDDTDDALWFAANRAIDGVSAVEQRRVLIARLVEKAREKKLATHAG